MSHLSRAEVHKELNPNLQVGILVSQIDTSSDIRSALYAGMLEHRVEPLQASKVNTTRNLVDFGILPYKELAYVVVTEDNAEQKLLNLLGKRPSKSRRRKVIDAILKSDRPELAISLLQGTIISSKKLPKDIYYKIACHFEYSQILHIMNR